MGSPLWLSHCSTKGILISSLHISTLWYCREMKDRINQMSVAISELAISYITKCHKAQKRPQNHSLPRSFRIKARLVRIPHNQWIHAFPRSLRKKNVRLRCPTSSFLMVHWINCKGSRTLLLSDQHLKWWIWLYLHCNFEVMKIWSVSPTCILILTKVSCKWEYQASVDMFCNHFPS